MIINILFVVTSFLNNPSIIKTYNPSIKKCNNPLIKSYIPERHTKIVSSLRYKYISCDYDNNEKCFAYCPEDNVDEYCTIIAKKSVLDNTKILIYISFWFILSAKYNIYNKKRLIMLNLPWFQSVLSLGTGSLIAIFFWVFKMRKPPQLNFKEIKTYIPISFFHALGHITAVISVSAGAVSFTQIVKAAEPIFTSSFNWILLGDKITLPVGLSLIPIILGVSFASISELYFTWTSFINAMLSNVAFAGRNVCSRLALDKPKGKNITPENLFGILTIISFIISIPLAIIFESNKIEKILLIKNAPLMTIFKTSFETGMYFYLYNEAAMVVLNNINPVSHAIINTLKRIILLIVCVIFFNTPLTKNGIIGSSIAIFGSYLYAKAKKK
tara:strand:- start:4057 stop:5211 length:1155 start_codon:yes stop_codon:yes gene_type:complete